MSTRTSYSCTLNDEQRERLREVLSSGNYRPVPVPHTIAAVEAQDCRVNLYKSGKCLVQGKGTEAFVLFVLEPLVLLRAGLGYEAALHPETVTPHMGIDESGKGDFFGPLVTVAAFVDAESAKALRALKVRDSKQIKNDKQALAMGAEIRKRLQPRNIAIVKIGPRAYNRLYAKIRNVNRLLAWAHARAIENLLDTAPDCPRAVADQFGARSLVEKALMRNGRKIKLEQRHKAESDVAVAAASILAREAFLRDIARLSARYEIEIRKGASDQVRAAAVELVKKQSDPTVLLETAKCHFRTTDAVLSAAGFSRRDLGPEGAAVSRASRATGAPRSRARTETRGKEKEAEGVE